MNSDQPLRTVSVVEAVAEGLRDAIFSGEVGPGVPLAEASLSERFDVPRPTVRSALMLLQHDGLMRREPNRSSYVPVLSHDDVVDLFAVRRMIELEATRVLVDDDIRPVAAQRALRFLEALTIDDGWDEVVRFDFALHQALVDAVESPRLSKIYQSVSAETRLAMTQLRDLYTAPEEIAQEHRVMMDAIESGDRDRALEAVREHLDYSEQVLLDRLARETTGTDTDARERAGA